MATTVTYKGPLFQTDAGKAVKKAIQKVVSNVAAAGKKQVMAELTDGHGRDTGEYRKGIRYKRTGMNARVYARDARIASWLEGKSKLNARSKFKGYGIMADATKVVDRDAGAEARRIVAELVQELGG